MTDRIEALIVPAPLWTEGVAESVTACLGASFDRPRRRRVDCGRLVIVVVDGRGAEPGASDRGSASFCVTEGDWPEAIGLRLSVGAGRCELHADRFSIRPVFHGSTAGSGMIVSTRPEVVSAFVGARLSEQGVAEQLALGFNMDDRTIFTGVHRLRAGERIVGDARGSLRVVRSGDDEADGGGGSGRAEEALVDRLPARVAGWFAEGHSLELSGGIDSRLVLAMGMHAGQRPALAFTLGSEGDSDVVVARAVCERAGIEHLVLPLRDDASRLAIDGQDFVSRAGFAANAASYAWFPSVFRRLAPVRDGQVGGAGGECAGGFYFTPFDGACRSRAVIRQWCRRRLLRQGHRLRAVMGSERARAAEEGMISDAVELLGERKAPWRDRVDDFYLGQRLRQWAGPVLSASACWYRPAAPLLSGDYIRWARSLPASRRLHRRAQLDLTARLAPGLAGVPYAGGSGRSSNPVGRWAVTASEAASKVRRRLTGAGGSPDRGSREAIEGLMGSPEVRAALGELVSPSVLGVRPDFLENAAGDPAGPVHELGALITSAWAWRAVSALGAGMTGGRPARVGTGAGGAP